MMHEMNIGLLPLEPKQEIELRKIPSRSAKQGQY